MLAFPCVRVWVGWLGAAHAGACFAPSLEQPLPCAGWLARVPVVSAECCDGVAYVEVRVLVAYQADSVRTRIGVRPIVCGQILVALFGRRIKFFFFLFLLS